VRCTICLLLLACLFASAVLVQESGAQEWCYRWYAWAEIPQVLWPETSPPTDTPVPLYEARATVEVKANTVWYGAFDAFYLYIGNPTMFEWIEVGYYQNRTGYYWFSDKMVAGSYTLTVLGVATVGENRTLKVTSVGTAYIDDEPRNYVKFTPTDSPYYYGVKGESSNPYNTLHGNFYGLKVGLWEYDSHDIRGAGWIYVLRSWFVDDTVLGAESPYHVQGITGSGYTQVLTWGQKRMVRPGRGGGGRCRLE